MNDSLQPEAVESLLRGRFGHPYVFIERCASTQRLLGPDAPEGAVVATDEQTEGRGRLGRRWEAPAGTGLLFSVLLRPPLAPSHWPELSVVAGRAVAAAITETTGLEAAVKHPNDVLVGDRKVAGILAEASEDRVVLGIGVNVHQTGGQLPADAQHPPTSLCLEGASADRATLLAAILGRLEDEYDRWVSRTAAAG